MIASVVSGLGAVAAAFAVIWTVRAQRRLTKAQAYREEQLAGQVADARIASLRQQLDQEYLKRAEAERLLREGRAAWEAEAASLYETIAEHESRIVALEDQVRSLGGTPLHTGG